MSSLLKIRGIMFLLFSLVISLKCNECNSAESWDKCTNKEVTCPSGLDQYLKGHAKYGKTKVYARSCSTKDFCDKENNPVCKRTKGISGAECEITCCDKDLCKAGSETKISGIVLLTCTLVFLAFQEAWDKADISDFISCFFFRKLSWESWKRRKFQLC